MPRKLKNWLDSYCEYAKHSEAPMDFHWWTGVFTIAAALGRKCYFNQEYYIWSPNFYIVLVAPPGVATKSTTVGIAERILSEVPGVNIGPNAVTWQELVNEMEQSTQATLMLDGSYLNNSPISLISSELGSLIDFRDGAMIQVMTDLWDNRIGNWKKATKTQGNNKIENPWINIIGCTTPSWLQGSMPTQMIGGGFASRTVWLYADKKRQLVPYPRFAPRTEGLPKLKDDLLEDLITISGLRGEFEMTPEAIQFGSDWYFSHWGKPPRHLLAEDLGGYRARKQTHAHKLAMVLAASENDHMILDQHHLAEALDTLTRTEENLPAVFNSMYVSEDMQDTTSVLGKVFVEGSIEKRKLYEYFMSRMSLKDFDDAIMAGIYADKIISIQKGNELFIESKLSGTHDR